MQYGLRSLASVATPFLRRRATYCACFYRNACLEETAEMESAAQQVAWGGAIDAISRFLCRNDFNDTAIVAPHQVAVAQYGAV